MRLTCFFLACTVSALNVTSQYLLIMLLAITSESNRALHVNTTIAFVGVYILYGLFDTLDKRRFVSSTNLEESGCERLMAPCQSPCGGVWIARFGLTVVQIVVGCVFISMYEDPLRQGHVAVLEYVLVAAILIHGALGSLYLGDVDVSMVRRPRFVYTVYNCKEASSSIDTKPNYTYYHYYNNTHGNSAQFDTRVPLNRR
jgi:hypothetical protein